MKKTILLLAFISVTLTGNAQKIYAWMDCGLKASYGLTGLVNTNLFDDRNYEHHLSTGYGLGGKVGLYFGLFNGITADFMFSTNNQEFDYFRGTPATNFTHNIKWSNYDLALLYRLQKDGIYVELGPQLSLLRSVKNADANDSRTDVKAFYQNYYSGLFGVGGYIFNYETFTTMLGIRLGYSFTDFVSASGKEADFPTPNQVAQYDYKSTNPAFVQLVLEANFALGYYGRTSCSKRATIFSFGG
ncbi:MAG: hypothetical protein IPP06_14155 [Saprospiraceae bacterium]|nr:hypothetical protein [Candidatus Vicinibacter affinis]MBP6173575.1 hypothetical protein [Saprospiraceae bacterium]MBK6573915.1 hypothetical protein [Candidatus Vicinibacter affinis]MBK6821638.1 hypothetical protein [Candidatus Vicinibacter affinis]MBK7302855.1 hypothetical protein [Candidatus Vicinibacter affinis]